MRACQIILIASILWASWLAMMLVHEGGHILGAICTGGQIRAVIWHPLVFSRTDVQPNPHPLIEVWAGPVLGCLLPLAVWCVPAIRRWGLGYLVAFFVGFCLIANGAYVGVGAFDPVGDAREMIRLGTPRGAMIAFGFVAMSAGFYLWHAISPRLGFGREPAKIGPSHVLYAVGVAFVLTGLGIAFGHRG